MTNTILEKKSINDLLNDLFWDEDRVSSSGLEVLNKIEPLINNTPNITSKNKEISRLISLLEWDFDRMSSSGQETLIELYKRFEIYNEIIENDDYEKEEENNVVCSECKTRFRKDVETNWINDEWCVKNSKFICNDCLDEISTENQSN